MQASSTKKQNFLKRTWNFLVRVDVASVLIVALLLLAVVGSCFPQRPPEVITNPASMAHWEAGILDRYGPLAKTLTSLGVFRFSETPVFIACLALLGMITLFCLLDRWQAIWRKAFQKEVQRPEVVFQAAPYTACLTIPPGNNFSQTLQENLGQRGFRLKFEHTNDTTHFRADRYRLSVLATLVSHLGLVLLLAGAIISGVFSWREVVTLPPGEPVAIDHRRNINLENEGFTIEHYPNGSASGYEANIKIRDSNLEESQGRIRINEPLTYAGVSFYLQGFTRTEAGDTITLLAEHDPGYTPIILAGFLLLLGISVTFNFPYSVIYGRIELGSQLRLAGSAERWASDFETEFDTLVERFQQRLGQSPGGGEQVCRT